MPRRPLLLLVLAACGGPAPAEPDAPAGLPDAAVDAPEGTVAITVLRSLAFPDEPFAAQVVAYQDGDGPWQLAQGGGGHYVAAIAGPRYGVVVACEETAPLLLYRFTTLTEDPAPRFGCAQPPLDAVRVDGQVLGTGGESGHRYLAAVDLGLDRGDVAYAAVVHRGRADLIASVEAPGTGPGRSLRIADLALAVDRTIAIDFAASTPNLRVPITVTNRAGGNMFTRSMLRVVLDSGEAVRYRLYQSHNGLAWVETIAPSLLRDGDLVQESAYESTPGGVMRYAHAWLAAPASVTLDLPRPFAVLRPDLTVDPTHPRLDFPVGENSFSHVAYLATILSAGPALDLDWSAGWVDGQPRVAMALPDLRGLAGWSAAFEVPGYGGIAWWLQRYSATAPEVAADVRAELASQFGIDGPRCGDAVVQPPEACDDGGDTPTCDRDCTARVCGDGYRNDSVEDCDPPDGVTCDATCHRVAGAVSGEARDQRRRGDRGDVVVAGAERQGTLDVAEAIAERHRVGERR
ncbi:MAG: hypothetical protein IPH44_04160 [Myxococcales bacterium]|nr:hypothetical protein [Myxococcales bacterium]MBK7193853.1 hypothetical protein [Myxococcales bacterium]